MKRIAFIAAMALFASGASAQDAAPAAAATCAKGTVMNIVAHQDDDLVFWGAAKVKDLDDGKCSVTVVMTAGDNGRVAEYWLGRETGAALAAETLARVKTRKPITAGSIKLNNRKVATRKLQSDPRVSFVFLRLPDGDSAGQGIPNGAGSLRKLFAGNVKTLRTIREASVDGLAQSATYTRSSLKAALLKLMTTFKPSVIRVQNYLDVALDGGAGAIDHSDHVASARFAQEAATAYASQRGKSVDKILVGYRGEDSFKLQQNTFGDRLEVKLAAFKVYSKRDDAVCLDALDCVAYRQDYEEFKGYPRWLRREYTVKAKKTPFRGDPVIGFGGKCLEVRGASKADGAVIQMSACAGPEALHQQWEFVSEREHLKNALSGKCADFQRDPVTSEKVLRLNACGVGGSGQTWNMDADTEVTSFGAFGCLNVPGDLGADGAEPFFTKCTFSVRQRFGYGQPPISPVPHTLVGERGGLCLHMARSTNSNSTPDVTGETCDGSRNQQWFFTPAGKLRTRLEGLCANVLTDTAANGEPIRGDECEFERRKELWGYDAELRGIVNQGGTDVAGKCFSQRNRSAKPGVTIEASDCLEISSQRFLIDGKK